MTISVLLLTFAFIGASLFAWRSMAGWFIALSPLWYAPFLFVPDAYGAQWDALRAGKDWISAGLLATWCITVLRRGSLVWVKDGCAALTLTFVFVGTLRFLMLGAGQAIPVARIFLLSPLWFFAARDLIVDDATAWRNLRRWITVGSIVSIIALIEYALGGTSNVFSRASGQVRAISTLFNPNALGWYLVWVNGLLLGWTLKKREAHEAHLPMRVAIGLWALNLIAIGVSGSRSSAVVAVVFLVVWFLLTSRRAVAVIYMVTMAVVSMAAWFVVIGPRVDQLRVFSGSGTLRWAIYTEAAGNLTRAEPLQVLIGVDASLLAKLDLLGIFDDSFLIALVGYGGLLSAALLFGLIVIAFFSGVRSRDGSPRAPFLFAACALAILGVLGNVQAIFPHGLLFWVSLGLASRSAHLRGAMGAATFRHFRDVPRRRRLVAAWPNTNND